jgi:sulfite reductase (NADPH) flavoprotein alpha-component
VHLTVARVQYQVSGKERRGVCSHFLCDQMDVENQKVGVYLQSTRDFRLPPSAEIPIIMIGPGTGVAPFRAFMQERMKKCVSYDKNWLFFGERHSKTDFFYEDFWKELVTARVLRLDLAFSRDQEEKIYVQNRMWEKKEDFWKWLENGAVIYVCGNASHMAKDVDAMLHAIVESEGKMPSDKAREFVKKLRHDKRYIRDVY